jgi:trimethylamine--corrinoid protein Co-methyltransferase
METMLKYSHKPICFITYEWEGIQECIEMLELVAGGAEQLRNRPTAALYLNPTTAFQHNESALRKLLYAADRHFPIAYLPDVQRGLTAPITYAGAMASVNAGQLVGLLLAQLVSEGAPVILNAAVPSTLDMRTMIMPYVEPEGRSVSLEMNFYYQLPVFSTGGCTDSKLLDEQAIMESTASLFYAALRGGNMIHDIGYMESGLMGSLELVVICDEIISWLKASMKGLQINQETLALDVIHKHALSGDFLGASHTRKHVRDDWQPKLVDRHNHEQWMAGGGTSMRERARKKIEEILATEQQNMLSSDLEKKLGTITRKVVESQTR